MACDCRRVRDEDCPCFFQGKQAGFHRGVRFVEEAVATEKKAGHDTPTVTERQAVGREREAFESGWCAHRSYRGNPAPIDPIRCEYYARYPLPKVRRLRQANIGVNKIVRWNPETAGGWEALATSSARPDMWYPLSELYTISIHDVAVCADLKANPWEEVSCD